MHRTWKKGVKEKLGKHFNTIEFQCQCKNSDCVDQQIAQDLIDKLNAVREELKAPLTVTSAYRCLKHQESLRKSVPGAAKTSQHTDGNAVDVKAVDMNLLYGILEKHFMAIGIAKNFYHVDLRRDKKRRWNY